MGSTHLSLFSGFGGLDIAAEMAGFQTVGQCEFADYPYKVLSKHWPDIPKWRDIRTLTGEDFYAKTGLRTVDVISGGFPCQPFSVAGKRRGAEDDRYLWPEMLRVIEETNPTWVVGENVAGIVNLALDTVLSDLEDIGYETQAFVIPACATDAAHRRDRVAIVAHASIEGNRGLPIQSGEPRQTDADTDGRGEDVAYAQGIECKESISTNKTGTTRLANGGVVADTDEQGLQGRQRGKLQKCSGERITGEGGTFLPDVHNGSGNVRDAATAGFQNGTIKPVGGQKPEPESERSDWRATESRMGGVADGIPAWMDGYWVNEPDIPRVAAGVPNRVEKLKGLGNAVYWRQFYPIFKAIHEIEMADSRI